MMSTILPAFSRWPHPLSRFSIRYSFATISCRGFSSPSCRAQEIEVKAPQDGWHRTVDNYLHAKVPQALFHFRLRNATNLPLKDMLIHDPEYKHDHTPRAERATPFKRLKSTKQVLTLDDGLIHPYRMTNDKKYQIVLKPHGFMFYALGNKQVGRRVELHTADNPLEVFSVPQDTAIPTGLELVQATRLYFMIQPDSPISLEEFNKRMMSFLEASAERMTMEGFTKRFSVVAAN